MTSEGLIINIATVVLTDGALVGACTYAWLKGGAAERYAAVTYLCAALGTFLVEIATGQILPMLPMLLLDTLVAVSFLFLAVRYNSLWLGAAMMLKGGQLALHATHLTDAADPKVGIINLYAIGLDAVSVLISAALVGGTWASVRARRRTAAAYS